MFNIPCMALIIMKYAAGNSTNVTARAEDILVNHVWMGHEVSRLFSRTCPISLIPKHGMYLVTNSFAEKKTVFSVDFKWIHWKCTMLVIIIISHKQRSWQLYIFINSYLFIFDVRHRINNDWSFDDEISAAFGCQVFAFDPSMNKGERVETTLRTTM